MPLVSLTLVIALAGARSALAEEATLPARPPTAPSTPSAIAVPSPAPAPARPRAISPTLATQLSALSPKYEPVATAPAGKPIEPGTDLREIDKPRNTIIRLPNFEVQEEKVPEFKPRELLTPPERLRLAFKKYPGLHVGSLPFFNNNGVALMMQAEDERLERMKEMSDLLTLLPAAQQKQVKPAVDGAFLRHELPR
jgi:hypothetical protein